MSDDALTDAMDLARQHGQCAVSDASEPAPGPFVLLTRERFEALTAAASKPAPKPEAPVDCRNLAQRLALSLRQRHGVEMTRAEAHVRIHETAYSLRGALGDHGITAPADDFDLFRALPELMLLYVRHIGGDE